MGQTLKFLGRGSAFNVSEGNTSAYIKDNKTLFLIDCGSSVFEKIITKNLFNGVKNVYVAITHRHSDHIGSLGDLIFYCYYKLHIKPNLFFVDGDLRNYLLSVGVTDDKYEVFYSQITELNININLIYAHHCGIYQNSFGDISNEYHESDNPKDLFNCFSFIIDYKGKKIFYSGDCSYVNWYDSDINSCDEFYVDCCFADYNGNVHYNVNKLYLDLCRHNYIEINLSDVYCIHFDCIEAIEEALKLGFNIVELE